MNLRIKEKTLSGAVERIACSYVVLHLDINLFHLNVLPDAIAYLFLFYQLDIIARAEESARLLEPLALLLTVWDLLTTVLGEHLGIFREFGSLVAGAVGLYFHFQLMTNLASIADRINKTLGEKMRRLRTAQTIFITVMRFLWPTDVGDQLIPVLAALALQVCITVWTMVTLWDLSRYLQGTEPEELQPLSEAEEN